MEHYHCKHIHNLAPFCVSVPGSKSITNRALLIGALAKEKTTLHGVLFSDDSVVFMEALQAIGFPVTINRQEKTVSITGFGGHIPKADNERQVYVGSAGTAARFLTAMLGLSGQRFYMTASPQMEKRPMEPLLRALESMGVQFQFPGTPYAFPFHILGYERHTPDYVLLNMDASSQFLSALLLCSVMCEDDLRIRLTGSRDARAYVNISTQMMEAFGVKVCQLDHNTYQVSRGQTYQARTYQIEPDISAACYFYALAAVCGTTGKVLHVHRNATQGDIQFLQLLEQMGCQLTEESDGIVLTAPVSGTLSGVSVNMSDFSDQTMTLAAIAPFAASPTTIHGVAHIRGQESDRIHGIVTELSRMSISVEEYADGLTIMPGTPKGIAVNTYQDHRMAMAFAITGCMTENMQIQNPMCCQKTFRDYFTILDQILQEVP